MLNQGVPPDQSANTSPEAGHEAASAGHHRPRQGWARHPEPAVVLVPGAGAPSEPGDPVCAGEKPQRGFTGEEAVPFHPDTRRGCYLCFTDWDVRHGGNVTC